MKIPQSKLILPALRPGWSAFLPSSVHREDAPISAAAMWFFAHLQFDALFTRTPCKRHMGNDEQGKTARERMNEKRLRSWILIDGDRWLVAVGLTVSFFVVLILTSAFGPPSFRATMRNATQVRSLFQALIVSLITGVTLIIAIGQLVLSEEFGSLSEKSEEIDSVVNLRRDLDESVGSVGPPDPAMFFQWLIKKIKQRAEALEETIRTNHDDELCEQVSRFVEDLVENAEEADEQLETAQFGDFTVIQPTMDFDYSWKTYGVLWLRSEYDDELSDEERESFDALLDMLMHLGSAREHFKSLYFQWELVRLLRWILATSIPALAVAVATMLYIEPNSFPGVTFGMETIIWVVSASATLAVVPFFILASLVLRIGTAAKRTSTIGPFILHDSDWHDDIDMER